MARLAVVGTLAASAAYGLSTAFVAPGAAPWRAAASRFAQGSPQEQAGSMPSLVQGVGVAAVAAVAMATTATLRRRATSTLASRPAVRRDLAVAYEDSGIDLIDNGKFCQGLVGAEGAWGRYEYDPVGFSKYTELVPYLREAELKHGRIAMLAWIGMVVPDFVRIPGERFSFEKVPCVIDAHDAMNGANGANFQILFWISIVEFCCAKKVFEWNSLECAGDYGFGVQFLPKDEEGQRRMRLAELKNGRLAMIAFGGAVTQAVITRHPFPWLF